MTTILMRKGSIFHDVDPHDITRWESYGYEAVNTSASSSGKEVAEEASSSSVASSVAPRKRTSGRKKVQKDDKS